MNKVEEKDSYLYMKLYEELKSSIIKNYIPDSKFYSIRQIGIKHSVNVNTALKTFKLLENDGYIFSRKGKGYFIKSGLNINIDKDNLPIMEDFHYGQWKKEEINFANGSPASELFPIDLYSKYLIKALEEEGNSLLNYQDIRGLKSLRELLSSYLEKDSIFTHEDNILITSGTQHSLMILLKVFSGKDMKKVGVSAPTYPNTLNLLKGICDIKTFKLKDGGWDLVEFEKTLKKERIHFVYLVTNYQNPTGFSWNSEKKEKLLELAHKYDFYIVEDDCFSEFYYGRGKRESIKSLDRIDNEKVIYIKTYSKIFMPGISLAYMVVPKELRQKISLVKYTLDHNTSGVNQKVLEYFIKDGELENHVEKIRKIFKVKYKHFLEIISKYKDFKVLGKPTGGFFFWLELDKTIDGKEFYKGCKRKKLKILPGSIFYLDKNSPNKIRISFISSTNEEIDKGISIMYEVIKEIKEKSKK